MSQFDNSGGGRGGCRDAMRCVWYGRIIRQFGNLKMHGLQAAKCCCQMQAPKVRHILGEVVRPRLGMGMFIPFGGADK